MKQDNIFVLDEKSGSGRPLRLATVAPPSVTPAFADFNKIQVGDEAQFCKTITAEDVDHFARLSGDRNPLHMDEQFAARTQFQRRVVHGMLVASYVSTIVGMHCPGPGALWSQQNYRWPLPVFIGDQIQFKLRVTQKSLGARALTFVVNAINQDGKVVMEGDGTVTVLEDRQQQKEPPISERVAFVSGVCSVNAAIASMLAQAGASVVVSYDKGAVAAEELCAAIGSSGARAIAVQADLSDSTSVINVVQKARDKFNHPIDLLINNAGTIPEPRPFVETNWDNVQSMLDLHLRRAFHCCQAVIPGMVEQKSGRIINIGSAFARGTPLPHWSSFLMAKSAMQAMTRCLAAELGPQGIRVNMVSPGMVEAEAVAGLPDRLRKVQAMQTPLRRHASAIEIAAVVVALCSGAGDFITGTEIPVSGGLQM